MLVTLPILTQKIGVQKVKIEWPHKQFLYCLEIHAAVDMWGVVRFLHCGLPL
jgi:hypothetical protein